jgi:hypothetical protein
MVNVIRFYKTPGLSPHIEADKLKALTKLSPIRIKGISTECCFYVEIQSTLTDKEILQIRWVLAPVLNPDLLTDVSRMPFTTDQNSLFIEIGPR